MIEEPTPSPLDAGIRDNLRRRAGWKSASDPLVMPEVDDPAADGHMWGGAETPVDDSSATEGVFDAPAHIPTHPTQPSPF